MITVHLAPTPQDPGHGSLHFSRIQAKLLAHSELIVHSGRQFGGLPIKLPTHEHEGDPPISRHCELGPQGDGKHGSIYTGGWGGGDGAKKLTTLKLCEIYESVKISNRSVPLNFTYVVEGNNE